MISTQKVGAVRLTLWSRGRFTRSSELNSVSCREQRNGPRKEFSGVKRGPNQVERQRVLEVSAC